MNQPKKSLGQHWLSDVKSLDSVVEMGQVKAGDRVLEIGPGLGTLTARLLKVGAEVIAVEYDQELFEVLEAQNVENLNVVHEDILRFNLKNMGPDYKIVANIPYYLSGKLLRKLMDTTSPPTIASLLLQKEVAERLAARPGKLTILGVLIQHYFKVELGPVIKAELFDPIPKVDSQIVKLISRPEPIKVNTKFFKRLVKAGFGEKRKKLINSLAGGLDLEKNQLKSILKQLGLSPDVRAQQLTLDEWYELEKILRP